MIQAKRKYGWKRDLPRFQRNFFVGAYRTPPVQEDLDMRPLQPPIYDQETLGSCTANGICSELEAQALAQNEPLPLLSRLFVYYNERAMEGTISSDAGANIFDGMTSVGNTGVCPEDDWPYIMGLFALKPPDKAYADATKFKSLIGQTVVQSEGEIKAALCTGRGLVCGISVYESFESDMVAGTGFVPMPQPDEKMLGGHCIRIVGYTDNGLKDVPEQHFIGMNSWGTDWGLKGFFAIPYQYILEPDLSSDFYLVTSVSNDAAAPQEPTPSEKVN